MSSWPLSCWQPCSTCASTPAPVSSRTCDLPGLFSWCSCTAHCQATARVGCQPQTHTPARLTIVHTAGGRYFQVPLRSSRRTGPSRQRFLAPGPRGSSGCAGLRASARARSSSGPRHTRSGAHAATGPPPPKIVILQPAHDPAARARTAPNASGKSLRATPTERHRLWGQATQRDAHAGGRRTWGAFRGAPAAAARFVVVGADDPEMPKSMLFAGRLARCSTVNFW